MKLLTIITIIFAYIYLIVRLKKALHMLQQNLYNDGNRYLKWVLKNISSAFFIIEFVLVTFFFLAYLLDKEIFLYFDIFGYIILTYYFLERGKYEEKQVKKPLVVTSRIKRLIITLFILYLVPLFFGYYFKEQTYLYLLCFSILIFFVYFVVYLANIINKPIERCVYYYYYFKAMKKLKSFSNLKVVGITGSYGKTSSKNILNDILNVKMVSHPTPKNLNTEYGLMITINNHLDKFDEVFIAEMGAYRLGEIKKLCDMVHPKYAILTRIGTSHLETFGSEKNIQKTKFELIESLPEDGIAVLNGDDPKQLSYHIKSPCKKIWIGIENKDVDIYADHIKVSHEGSQFDVHFTDSGIVHTFKTKLLGNHNIYNILASIALALEFGMSISEIDQGVHKVKTIEHRLQIKAIGNIHMIDDAYNSNPVGAKMALDVLKMMPGTKVVVTPGMIELGEKEREYNYQFGTQIASVSDYVVLIGEKKTEPIYDGLIKVGFDDKKIFVLNDVKESFALVSSLKGKEEIYALYENDLPDSYNEKNSV